MKSDFEYDIGLVYRSNHNYGANMTHYALYHVLASWGYRIALIDLPEDSEYYLPIDRYDPYELYAKVPFDDPGIRFRFRHKWDLLIMNDMCKIFVVGSDQLWRHYFVQGTAHYSTLDWVIDGKFKMSYATSFGVAEYEGNEEEERALAWRLDRLNAVSVREESGVSILHKMLNREAVCVSDPVFLCPIEKYYELAEKGKSRLPDGKYIAAYLLDRSNEKDDFIKRIGSKSDDMQYVLIEDAMVRHIYQEREELNPLQYAKVEEWLAMIKNCEFLITDSYHGTCFAIIFRKQFVTISSANNHRGHSRIAHLLSKLGLEDRIINDMQCVQSLDWENRKIDYQKVSLKLEKFASQSKAWLKSTLENAAAQVQRPEKQLPKDHAIVNDLQMERQLYNTKLSQIRQANASVINPDDKVYVWGTGQCFMRNIKLIDELYEIAAVVDSNSERWGGRYLRNLVCISPQNLLEMRRREGVIILVENDKAIKEIKRFLEDNEIFNWITYEGLC